MGGVKRFPEQMFSMLEEYLQHFWWHINNSNYNNNNNKKKKQVIYEKTIMLIF